MLRIPSGGLAQVDGEDGAVAVDDIAPEELRDLQPRLLRQALDVVAHLGADAGRLPLAAQRSGGVDDRAGPAAPDEVAIEVLEVEVLVQLADLLVQGHLGEEIVDEGVGGVDGHEKLQRMKDERCA